MEPVFSFGNGSFVENSASSFQSQMKFLHPTESQGARIRIVDNAGEALCDTIPCHSHLAPPSLYILLP